MFIGESIGGVSWRKGLQGVKKAESYGLMEFVFWRLE